MGCARFVWNAKCEDDYYLRTFARKYLPLGTYPPIDQQTSKYKTELSPWLKDCPSQILRNTATNWKATYTRFLKGECGRPVRKKKSDKGSIHLTRELFDFRVCKDGVTRLFIGSKTNNIGFLPVKLHARFNTPNSIYIRRENGRYFVSFCYEDGQEPPALKDNREHLKHLQGANVASLADKVIGIDRGIAVPVQAGLESYFPSVGQTKNKHHHQDQIKTLQRKLSRQKIGSGRYKKTKRRLKSEHEKVAAIRNDFWHKTSRKIVDSKASVIIFEDLKIKNMSASAKGSLEKPGKKVKQKSGLNRSILDQSWHRLEAYTKYKAHRANKAFFKVAAHHTSQECAECEHIHPDNRQSQARFVCVSCGHSDNADRNAALVIAKRAIKLITHSGTELSDRGVLYARDQGKGRGANSKSKPRGVLQVVTKRQKGKDHVGSIRAA
jgi:putative transposase